MAETADPSVKLTFAGMRIRLLIDQGEASQLQQFLELHDEDSGLMLLYACSIGQAPCAKVLLEAGAPTQSDLIEASKNCDSALDTALYIYINTNATEQLRAGARDCCNHILAKTRSELTRDEFSDKHASVLLKMIIGIGVPREHPRAKAVRLLLAAHVDPNVVPRGMLNILGKPVILGNVNNADSPVAPALVW